MRFRRVENYFATFDGRNTVRYSTDGGEIQSQLKPEILDISICSKCFANCPYCYTSALKTGTIYESVVEKINDLFGNLPLEERPFQVALGGEGEPTLHPEFVNILKSFYNLNIVPNYTTNGMHINDSIIEATKKYSGGVAVSAHPHLNKVWKNAVNRYIQEDIFTCVHLILGNPEEETLFYSNLNWCLDNEVNCVVVLPYQEVGRGKKVQDKELVWKKFFSSEYLSDRIAIGALFYAFLLKEELNVPFEIYHPEVFSGYIIMDDTYKTIRKSSYDLTEKTV